VGAVDFSEVDPQRGGAAGCCTKGRAQIPNLGRVKRNRLVAAWVGDVRSAENLPAPV
jgi:hypothetical protein